MSEKKRICCICGKSFYGWGNNPYPVKDFSDDESRNDNKCCDVCNVMYVVPARIKSLKDKGVIN